MSTYPKEHNGPAIKWIPQGHAVTFTRGFPHYGALHAIHCGLTTLGHCGLCTEPTPWIQRSVLNDTGTSSQIQGLKNSHVTHRPTRVQTLGSHFSALSPNLNFLPYCALPAILFHVSECGLWNPWNFSARNGITNHLVQIPHPEKGEALVFFMN